jgi:hypothetical protein
VAECRSSILAATVYAFRHNAAANCLADGQRAIADAILEQSHGRAPDLGATRSSAAAVWLPTALHVPVTGPGAELASTPLAKGQSRD